MNSWRENPEHLIRFRLNRLHIDECCSFSDGRFMGTIHRTASLRYEMHYRGQKRVISKKGKFCPAHVRDIIERVVQTYDELHKEPAITPEGQLCLL